MKKITLICFAVLAPFILLSQSVFDKYENMEHVGAVVLNEGVIEVVTALGEMSEDAEAKDFVEAASGLTGVKVFMTEDNTIAADMAKTVKEYVKSSKLEELMRVKNDGTNVTFYVVEGAKKDHVHELLMFVSGLGDTNLKLDGQKLETVLVSLTGDMDLNKIGALTSKMNLPEELNKLAK